MGVLPSLQRLVNISITHEIVCYFHNQTISMDDYGKVWPYWFGFAPYCRSFSATLTKPRRDAQKSGVCPRWFMLSTLTPVEVVIQKALMKYIQSKNILKCPWGVFKPFLRTFSTFATFFSIVYLCRRAGKPPLFTVPKSTGQGIGWTPDMMLMSHGSSYQRFLLPHL